MTTRQRRSSSRHDLDSAISSRKVFHGRGVPAPHEPDAVHGGFDASIEEILHCVTDQGASIVHSPLGTLCSR